MAVINDLGDSRPPPKRNRSWNITTPGIPWHRDIRVLRIIAQIIFAVLFVGAIIFIINNLVTNLNESSLTLDFNVFKRTFGVALSEGPSATSTWGWLSNSNVIDIKIPLVDSNIRVDAEGTIMLIWGALLLFPVYSAYKQYRRKNLQVMPLFLIGALILFIVLFPPADILSFLGEYFFPQSMARAFFTGIANTLQVVFLSLISCTIVGILVGIGLLSGNFLLRTVSKVYVEIFRNTPLLIQLLFIYRSLTLLLPFPRQSICQTGDCLGQNLYALNARGLYLVTPQLTESTNFFYFGVLIAFVVAFAIRRIRLQKQELTGEPARVWQTTLTAFIGITLISYVIATLIAPVSVLDFPNLATRNIEGGTQLTIGFFALFLGLTFYTSAFIAEIVRAGIQSVPHGQIEAARSQGLNGGQVLSLVVLPQALRLIIPPLGNQYVNLGKNSSLGIAVNYAETFRIAQLANNESGQAVPFFVGLMVLYLMLSLALSVMTNIINRATQIRTR